MRTWMLAFLLPAVGCLRNTAFKCDTSDQCGAGGTCQPTHYCSFADSTCGQKYGPQAGDLSGTCVGGTGIDAGVDAPGQMDAPMGDGGVTCPTDYVTLTGAPAQRRYKLLTTATDWVSQRSACNGTHTFLAAPENAAELAALDTLAGSATLYWIGVDDLQTAGTWLTVKNAMQSFLPWAPAFPTNNPNDQCVEVVTASAQFQNDRCTTSLPAICECE
ncbi:MAG: C-type lectin domain-containing protein [Acidobacteriota bacterium]